MASVETLVDELESTWSKIKRILGDQTEPFESVRLVETYRRYFRPPHVRTLLLAESHVFTSDAERGIAIPPIHNLPGYPTRYARFVYCLGYDERWLTGDSGHPRRDGTPQFWKIFFSCCNRVSALADFAPILSKTSRHDRLCNKVALLKRMQEAGIWLVDTSIVALYRNGRKSPDLQRVVEESWRSYTRQVVLNAHPDRVICIGRGAARVVEPDLQRMFPGRYDVIPQPNAHLSGAQHMENFKKYGALCNSVAA